MNENRWAKSVFKFVATLAIIALIFSLSRIYLTNADREGSAMVYAYDLAVPSQMYAFLTIVVVSILAIIAGVFSRKIYDIIGDALLYAGALSLLVITIVAYLVRAFEVPSSEVGFSNRVMGEVVLTLVLGIEWLGLLIYCFLSEKNPPTTLPSPTVPPPTPPAAPPTKR